MANTLTINDISAVANAVLANAQGRPATAANTSDFTTIAQTALLTGYDPLATAISQVLSRTIFSYRPYNAKFAGLEKDAVKWGNHVRKLNPIDKDLEVDNRLRQDNGNIHADGDTVDQYRINKPEVLQTNFYGSQAYQKSLTIWRDQLDTAFTGPEQFGNFLSMMMGNATDQLTQAREDLARGEDNEYNARIRKAGYTIWLDPAIRSTYYARATWSSSCKQMYSNGISIGNLAYIDRNAIGLRHLVPLAFVLALMLSLITACFTRYGWYAFGIIAGAYTLAAIVADIDACSKHGWEYAFILPAMFFSVHVSYGIGTLIGLVKKK